MDTKQLTQYTEYLTGLLAESFSEHGIRCYVSGDLVVFPMQRMTAYARLFDRSSSPSNLVLQLDITLEIGLGRKIIESLVGLGMDEENAIKDAWKNFINSSLHVFLSAFFTSAFDDQVSKEEWIIDGRKHEVVMSNVAVRGNAPVPVPLDWLTQFEDMIKSSELSAGTHWIRLYYSQSQREMMVTEILLDNDIWSSKEAIIRKFKYPTDNEFFSLRVFLILTSGNDVSRAASVLAWREENNKNSILDELMTGGMSHMEAEKAEILIPLAFGRVFLKGITTASFSDEAVVHNELNDEFVIHLNDEPVFTEAFTLAEKIMEEGCVDKQHFQNIIVQSSEFNAYNQALLDGSSPEDMNKSSFGSPIIYLPHYKYEDKLQVVSTKTPVTDNAYKKKEWWKFWKK